MARPRTVYPIGARVRHGGEQYSSAFDNGTAVITGHDWHGDHLEYLIHRDKPRFEGGPLNSTWAFYHTHLAETQPAEIRAALDALSEVSPDHRQA